MTPTVSIVCQTGGIRVALAYAKMVKDTGLPLLVNFPSMQGYQLAADASQLINEHTGAVIVVVSSDLFPGTRKAPATKIDTEIIHALLSASKTAARSRLFIIVADETAKSKIDSTWMGGLGWFEDDAFHREEIREQLRSLSEADLFGNEISLFQNAASIIAAIEPSCTIERIASERVSSENVSYEIFKCTHKTWGDDWSQTQFYVHLHRGITISNTARHFKENHARIDAAANKLIVMSIERGQVRPQDRVSNVQIAFECDRVTYLESIVSKMVSGALDARATARPHVVGRKFVEPDVIQGYGSNNTPSKYTAIVNWLAKPRPGVLVLVGQGGIGKTEAIMNLRALVLNNKVRFTKPIDRRVVFISSTDIARTYGRSLLNTQDITLYDLYAASCDRGDAESAAAPRLDRETFYNALELGSVIVFVDGLDEIITRHRGRFNPMDFFSDLSGRLMADSDAKVIVTCRNIFFDQDEVRVPFPYVETYELLAFNDERRDKFFMDGLALLPSRYAKATEISERLARLPEDPRHGVGVRYVPFVLDLIKEIVLEQADDSLDAGVDLFQSEILNHDNVMDRIVGQFCHREMFKILDPVGELTVDEQVDVFCRIARVAEGTKSRITRDTLETIMAASLGKSGVKTHIEHFLTHPFLSQELVSDRIVDFRFDFMPEYFLMLDSYRRMQTEKPIDESDIRGFNKFCSINSPFCRGIIERLSGDASDLKYRLIRMNEQAWEVVADRDRNFGAHDLDILDPDSAIAQYTFALVALLATFEASNGSIDTRSFTDGLVEVFGKPGYISRVALLDGFIREEERLRVDFRGLNSEDCLFHSFDIWNCEFDAGTVFTRSRFMNCTGVYSRGSGISSATFTDCQLDAEFERIYTHGTQKIRSSQAQSIEAIRSFVSDFYRQGGFRPLGVENLERFYSHSNSSITFKKMYSTMKRHAVIEEEDKGHYKEVKVARSACGAAERLINNGVLTGVLQAVAASFR